MHDPEYSQITTEYSDHNGFFWDMRMVFLTERVKHLVDAAHVKGQAGQIEDSMGSIPWLQESASACVAVGRLSPHHPGLDRDTGFWMASC
eukprot:8689117-Karenia_brevis.AAC.1